MMQATQRARSAHLTVIMANASLVFAAIASAAFASGPAEVHLSAHVTAPWQGRAARGTERAGTRISATSTDIRSPADAEPEAAGKTTQH